MSTTAEGHANTLNHTKARGGIWQLRRDTNTYRMYIVHVPLCVVSVLRACKQLGRTYKEHGCILSSSFTHAYLCEHICSDPVTHHNTQARA